MKIIEKLSQTTQKICQLGKKLQRVNPKRLARKKRSIAAFLGLVIPLAGYIYTEQFISFLLYCCGVIIYEYCLSLIRVRFEDSYFLRFLPCLIAAIDNAWAIQCARSRYDSKPE
jgi:hypothetical protein